MVKMNSKIVYLSYTITKETPIYGGSENPVIKKTKQIKSGDTSNNSKLVLSTHSGTHIDAPYHFYEEGRTIDQYEPEFWICQYPYVVDVNVEPEEIITIAKIIDQLKNVPEKTDLLLIRTDFSKYRINDTKIYTRHNPGIAPEIGEWLRQHRKIKMIGFDFISLSSYTHRNLGRKAHRAMLGKMDISGVQLDPILIIEDMDLSKTTNNLKKVIVSPLRFCLSDGSPVTVLGWIN